MMMKKCSPRQREHGIALLMTMLALMLLSVIALGMMVSTNTETSITSNFRDKQAATFAAMSGLQEVRDRIQPVTLSIVPPIDSPSLSAANVVYVINPKSGETIAPWDMSTTNLYKDTELCQEHVLSLSGTANVPCTTIPTGSAWYSVVNNSSSSSAPWNLSTPLDLKWTRLSLKTNNMTPIAVNGNTASTAIVCWDGTHQISLPAGYGTDCSPNGSLATIVMNNPGSGYTSTPSVTLSAPPTGGVQATATASVALTPNGIVQNATLTGGGSGYTSVPTVVLTGDGTGAAAVATISATGGAPVASVTMSSAGAQCYSSAPSVTISGGGGNSATASSTLAGSMSCIQGWTVSGNLSNANSCKSTLKGTTATIGVSGGGGSGFAGTITFSNGGQVTGTPVITNPGTGYTSTPTLNVLSGNDCGLTYTVNRGYLVQSVNLANGGNSYTSVPAVMVGTGTGTGAAPTAIATLGAVSVNAGQVTGITITSGGSGYTTAPLVTFSGGGGTGASATTTLGSILTLSCCTITNAGRGYTDDPTVTIAPPTLAGSTATAVATIGRGANYGKVYSLTSLAVTPNGSRTMLQMEATTPRAGWGSMGALTIDGPNPALGALPNSQNFVVQGADNNSCLEPAEPLHPAIAAYDDPNSVSSTSSVDQIIAALPRPDHYTGAGGTPSVVDVYDNLGETLGTPSGLKSLTDAIRAKGTSYTNNPGSINLGSTTSPAINYVDGDLTLNGNNTGYGILVVNGTLHLGGNFSWFGTVLVVGDGIMDFNGGGNGQIVGTALVAKMWDNHNSKNLLSSNGSPSISWNGGGGNGIRYDHCWATNMMNKIQYTPPPTTKQLRVLSTRQLPY